MITIPREPIKASGFRPFSPLLMVGSEFSSHAAAAAAAATVCLPEYRSPLTTCPLSSALTVLHNSRSIHDNLSIQTNAPASVNRLRRREKSSMATVTLTDRSFHGDGMQTGSRAAKVALYTSSMEKGVAGIVFA